MDAAPPVVPNPYSRYVALQLIVENAEPYASRVSVGFPARQFTDREKCQRFVDIKNGKLYAAITLGPPAKRGHANTIEKWIVVTTAEASEYDSE